MPEQYLPGFRGGKWQTGNLTVSACCCARVREKVDIEECPCCGEITKETSWLYCERCGSVNPGTTTVPFTEFLSNESIYYSRAFLSAATKTLEINTWLRGRDA